MGGIANIDQDGAASAGFHSEPDVIESADRQLRRGPATVVPKMGCAYPLPS